MSQPIEAPNSPLRREAVVHRQSTNISRERLIILFTAFSVMGALAGIGMSWLFMPQRTSVTVMRTAPTIVPCADSSQTADREAKLIFIDSVPRLGSESERSESDDSGDDDTSNQPKIVDIDVEFEWTREKPGASVVFGRQITIDVQRERDEPATVE